MGDWRVRHRRNTAGLLLENLALSHHAVQMGAVHGALAAAMAFVVPGHLCPRMLDAHFATADNHADLRANQPPRHAVVVGVHINAAIILHPPHELAKLPGDRGCISARAALPQR